MGKGDRLGELEALVLAALLHAGDGANGAKIYEEIEQRVRRDPGVSGVHVTLRRLETKGLVSSSVGTPSERGGRPRRFYRVTPAGTGALRDFREMWDRMFDQLPLPESGGRG